MHNITYSYPDNQNRLNSITATGLNSSNYLYDRLGNLTRDGGEGITIRWNTSGKVKSVTGGSSPLDFFYSALGQRQMKAYQADGGKAFDYYIHDATGNIMAIYTLSNNYSRFQLKEQHIYGSGRLGIYNRNIEIYPSEEVISLSFTRGLKRYELSNHLGNVNAVISDRKIQFKGGYMADIKTYIDYYPFGYQIPERTWSSSDYRFGFNGQEKDDEIYGEGNSTTAEYWQYDARLGRRWNVDMRPNFSVSSYATFLNNPIVFNDMLGDTTRWMDRNNNILMLLDDGSNKVTTKHTTQADRQGVYDLGIQWFEPEADNYMNPIWTNPNIATMDGIKHFTWNDIVNFADKYQSLLGYAWHGAYSDWKTHKEGADGNYLVTVAGKPYWADAVGQIPFAINSVRKELRTGSTMSAAITNTIKSGKRFGGGLFGESDNSKSYDNFMVIRGALFSEKRFERNTIIHEDRLDFGSKGVRIIEYHVKIKSVNYEMLGNFISKQTATKYGY